MNTELLEKQKKSISKAKKAFELSRDLLNDEIKKLKMMKVQQLGESGILKDCSAYIGDNQITFYLSENGSKKFLSIFKCGFATEYERGAIQLDAEAHHVTLHSIGVPLNKVVGLKWWMELLGKPTVFISERNLQAARKVLKEELAELSATRALLKKVGIKCRRKP